MKKLDTKPFLNSPVLGKLCQKMSMHVTKLLPIEFKRFYKSAILESTTASHDITQVETRTPKWYVFDLPVALHGHPPPRRQEASTLSSTRSKSKVPGSSPGSFSDLTMRLMYPAYLTGHDLFVIFSDWI